jgi:hypothetical protein
MSVICGWKEELLRVKPLSSEELVAYEISNTLVAEPQSRTQAMQHAARY